MGQDYLESSTQSQHDTRNNLTYYRRNFPKKETIKTNTIKNRHD